MPRHFSQADYNSGSPSPPGGHPVSFEFSVMSIDPDEVTESHTPYRPPLKALQSPRNAVVDDRSKVIAANNNPKAKPRSLGQQSNVTTPDQKSKLPSSRPVQSVHPQQSHDDSIHESQYQINMTRYEELFPDYTQGSVDDYSPPQTAQALPNAKELMSGVFEDGTPVFSPLAKKPRASRFVSGSHSRDSSGRVEPASFVEEVTPQFDVKKPRGSRFGSAAHSRDVSLKVDTPKVVDEAKKVPPPFDEKKVLASLNFLEKKVAALEKNRTQDEITIQQLRLETRIARAESKEKTKWRRSDSALGSTDGGSDRGDEMTSSQRKLMVEKNRLEATVTALQKQVDQLNQAASVSDSNINKVTRDRDQAVSQLGVAYFTVEQLKAEVESLQNHSIAVEELQVENQTLRDQSIAVEQLQAENQTLRDQSVTIEKLQAENQTLREDKSMLKRSVEQLIANQEDDTTMDMTTREEAMDREFERKARLDARQKQLDKMTTEKKGNMRHQESAFDNEPSQTKDETKLSSTSSRSSNAGDNDSADDITYLSIADPGKIGKLRKTLENERIARKQTNSRRRAPKIDETNASIQENTPTEENSQQVSFSQKFSFGPSDALPQRALKDLAIEGKNIPHENSQRITTPRNFSFGLSDPVPPQASKTDSVIQQKTPTHRLSPQEHFSRNFSLTDPEEKNPEEGSQQLTTSRQPEVSELARDHVDTPPVLTGSRFSQTKPEEMTSEWIINDITLDFSGYEGRAPPTPSKEARIPYHEDLPPVFPMSAEHESTNHRKETKAASRITATSKPTPASKPAPASKSTPALETKAASESIAMTKKPVPEPTPYEEDQTMESVLYEEEPTLRPSQPPSIALKSVMKGLEEELSQSKRQLAQYQELYNHQNPALGKRARKSLKEKMEVLLRAIDGKADYIYSLYDVLEGQKHQGSNIPEQLQATLQSVGAEMPWEGFMSETQTSNSSHRSRRSEA